MSEKVQIILIEDDEGNRKSLLRALLKAGYEVDAFERADLALEALRKHRRPCLVVTDLQMPGIDGFGVLDQAREIDPDVGVLMITGHGSVEAAVDAMKRGADDFLTKPVDLVELRERVKTIVQRRRLTRRVVELEERLGEKYGKLIGRGKTMETLFRQLDLIAPTRATVLVLGDSGTGKELVANALHDNSPRRSERFLPVNCAAIPADILESEMFGHERGSFTGAVSRKVGKFELADRGTLFLDEIGELPLEMQVKLLRIIESREFMRVGGTQTIKVDIRLIVATNKDLEALVADGRFREDLYYRLKVVTIKIPPLRERMEDIPLLARHFLKIFTEENGRIGMRFSPEILRHLVKLPWEGNVRELRNVVESLVVLAPDDEIKIKDLAAEYRTDQIMSQREGSTPDPLADAADGTLTMDEIERRAILNALQKTGGNRTQAAEILGIGLRTLQRKLKEYQMVGKGESE
jgi:DNA-binding NtrC family response regulator